MLDAATRRNLELDYHPSGQVEYTLLGVLDKTATAMGSRCLRRWINRPLRDQQLLNSRYACVGQLLVNSQYKAIHALLRQVGDIERISSRIALRSARPRDLLVLRNSLAVLPMLQEALWVDDTEQLAMLGTQIGEQPELLNLLQCAIIENPPVLIRDGGVIASGYNQALDELRDLSQNADQFLIDMENREKAFSRFSISIRN